VHQEELRLCPSGGGTPPVFAEILSRTPWAGRGVPERMSRWMVQNGRFLLISGYCKSTLVLSR
jgi:hypothetical protein